MWRSRLRLVRCCLGISCREHGLVVELICAVDSAFLRETRLGPKLSRKQPKYLIRKVNIARSGGFPSSILQRDLWASGLNLTQKIQYLRPSVFRKCGRFASRILATASDEAYWRAVFPVKLTSSTSAPRSSRHSTILGSLMWYIKAFTPMP